MPLSLFDIQTPVSRESVRALLLGLLQTEGFPVTAWQDESAARAFVEAQAHLGAQQSQPVALMAKMGFLQTAIEDYLDALVLSHYDLLRNGAVATVLPVRLVNAGATTYVMGARAIIVQARNGRTFSNIAGASVTAGAETTVSFTADVPGAAGNVPAQTLTLATALAGVTAVFDGVFTVSGADAEGDPQFRERARTKWATLRAEKIASGILNLVRSAAPSVHGVSLDQENPRGPGTVDVYLAAENATAGVSDVAAVQAALDGALFGTGTDEEAGLAIAAPTSDLNLEATVYVRGLTETAALTALSAAYQAFLETVPVGGFDLSPGPENVILPGQITDVLSEVAGVVSASVTSPTTDPILVAPHTKVLEGTTVFTVVVLET
jgi:uncharacterized phage protein gp47/JayE